jgi:hypothetical protein
LFCALVHVFLVAGMLFPPGANAAAQEITTTETIPAVTTYGTLIAFSSTAGIASAEQTYTAAGSNLTADISITAPADFEVSLTSGSGFSAALTLPPIDGTVAETTIYVRYLPAADGSSSGDIINASDGAITQYTAVSGVAAADPTIATAESTPVEMFEPTEMPASTLTREEEA